MAFGFLGSFRQTQWRNFRTFILQERRVANARLAMINAELARIGEVTVFYERRTRAVQGSTTGALEAADVVSERRSGFAVSPGSTLEKLLQAHIAMGGNPAEISLFLKPERVLWESKFDPEDDPDLEQNTLINDEAVEGVFNENPGFGVVAPESDNRALGGADKGGWLKWGRYPWRRIGRIINLSEADQQIAYKVDFARRWANPAIQEKRNNIEARILKQMDLREQLANERDNILVQALGGSVRGLPLPDPRQHVVDLHVVRIAEEIDNIVFGRRPKPRTDQERLEQQLQEVAQRRGANQAASVVPTSAETGNLGAETIPDFNTTSLEFIAQFDTLWLDEDDDDRYTAL